jgi:5-methylcytosine-specific restriction endonuclease McrA
MLSKIELRKLTYPKTRICKICGLEKSSIDDFYWIKRGAPKPYCKPCDKAYSYAGRKAHWDQRRAYDLRHYQENPQPARDAAKRYRLKHLDLVTRNAKKRRRKGGVDYEKQLAYNHIRRANKKGAICENSHLVTPQWWSEQKERQGGRCFYCLEVKPLTQDHVIPLTRGGRHEPKNIIGACLSCNSSKHNALLEDWRPEMLSLIAA